MRGYRPRSFPSLAALVLLCAALFLTSCIQGDAAAKPPDLHYGQDLCDQCGMIISDPRFASAYAYEIEQGRYESLAFDDVGCMVANIKANQDRKMTDFWVNDYNSEQWIDATIAFYVISPQIQSPMMHGVAALASEEEAKALAGEVGGEIFDWDHMRAQILMHDH